MKKIKNWKQRIFTLILTVVTFITAIPVTPVHAMDFSEQFYGGYDIAWEELNVYSSPQWTNRIGKIYKFEGFTVLMQNGPEGYLWVEYSTSNGAKRGYVQIPQDELGGRHDGVGKVTQNSTVYYGRTDQTGKYGSYQSTGTVYAGEIVAIIAKNDNWAYIEYNTNSGRKRGYMAYSNLHVYNRPGIFPDFYNHKKTGKSTPITGRKYVYAGPTSKYVNVFPKIAKEYNEKSWYNVKWCIEQSIKTMYNNTKISILCNYFNIEENIKPSLKFIIYTIVCKYNRNYN